MKKKQVFLSGLLMLMSVGMANAQNVYTYVQQNDVKIDDMGTAAFDLSSTTKVKFVDGKAVMTVGDNQVAVLPMSDNGQLAIEFSGTESNISKTLTDGYATVYSPFQLHVPETGDVEVYAPTYENGMLKLNNTTKVEPGAILPAGTGVILKKAETAQGSSAIDFTFSAEAATDTHVSALDGTALTTEKPAEEEGKTLYVLGYNSETNEYGFIPYNGEEMAPGTVYLLVDTPSEGEEEEEYVPFNSVDEEVTAISNAIADFKASKNGRSSSAGSAFSAEKFLENSRIIIVKNNKKYNLNGQEIK